MTERVTVAAEFDAAFQAELGRLFAADVHWMAQRTGVANAAYPPGELRIADTRYVRLLRAAADLLLTAKEQEAGAFLP